jgi:hypothetical protein
MAENPFTPKGKSYAYIYSGLAVIVVAVGVRV